MNYTQAYYLAKKLQEFLEPACQRIEVVGSVKRGDKAEVHDIEILCIADPRAPKLTFGSPVVFKNVLEECLANLVQRHILGFPQLNGPKLKKFAIIEASNINPFFLELYIVREDTWAIQNVIRTGPREFSQRFVTNKRMGGLLPDHYRYVRGETRIETEHGNIHLAEEKDAIALLELGPIEPKNRRNYVE